MTKCQFMTLVFKVRGKKHLQHERIKEMAFDIHLGEFAGSFTFEKP